MRLSRVICIIACCGLAACGSNARGTTASRSKYSPLPEHVRSGREIYHFDSFEELAAASESVFRATVDDVLAPVKIAGDEDAVREVRARIDDVVSSATLHPADVVTIENGAGWLPSGDGYVAEGHHWLTAGDHVLIFAVASAHEGVLRPVNSQAEYVLNDDDSVRPDIESEDAVRAAVGRLDAMALTQMVGEVARGMAAGTISKPLTAAEQGRRKIAGLENATAVYQFTDRSGAARTVETQMGTDGFCYAIAPSPAPPACYFFAEIAQLLESKPILLLQDATAGLVYGLASVSQVRITVDSVDHVVATKAIAGQSVRTFFVTLDELKSDSSVEANPA